jgi:peptidase E
VRGDPQIVAIGGHSSDPRETRALYAHVLSLTGRGRPRVLHVPTAVGDADAAIVAAYERLAGLCELSHARFFPWPPAGLRELVLAQDAISVGGGSTANMLAVWRVHGFDAILREAWEAGVLLFGASAGMICWFEAGVTDSFGPQLEGMRDGLGLLEGSACPHYDGEALRRGRYRELVAGGFPEGHAADDGAALRFVGRELGEVLSCRDGATAYRVTRAGEQRLEPVPVR